MKLSSFFSIFVANEVEVLRVKRINQPVSQNMVVLLLSKTVQPTTRKYHKINAVRPKVSIKGVEP